METKIEIANDLGTFEGFNFKHQEAIFPNVTAQELVNWDHDAKGEAEFWPSGDNAFVKAFFSGNCSGSELLEVDRIFTELDQREHDLVKAWYLQSVQGLNLEDISQAAIEKSCLYVFGPSSSFVDLESEAAYELFQSFWPDAYNQWKQNTVPGLRFDVDVFMRHFPTGELKLGEEDYLVVDTQ